MKVKLFYHDTCKTFSDFEAIINLWLVDNPNIQIFSTDRTSNSYMVLYETIEEGNDYDEVD